MSAFSAAAQDEDGDTIKTLQARVADLEAQLYAVGAGGVGKMEQPQSATDCHQSQPQGDSPTMTAVAQRKLDDLLTRGYQISGYSVYHDTRHQHGFVTTAGLVGWWKPEGAEYPQPQVEQEPVGCITGTYGGYPVVRLINPALVLPFGTALYTHPQPPRQPLTDLVKDAFFEGFVSVETYNDTRLNSVEDAWAEYKAAHKIGGEA